MYWTALFYIHVMLSFCIRIKINIYTKNAKATPHLWLWYTHYYFLWPFHIWTTILLKKAPQKSSLDGPENFTWARIRYGMPHTKVSVAVSRTKKSSLFSRKVEKMSPFFWKPLIFATNSKTRYTIGTTALER